mmetsp:Transcript_2467/g.7358  ORF Transcript_2467/g.7358 Transcript_2467/m.7358 type:complete len:327 (-) Transcript_2467:130-1110(-)
MTAPRNMRMHGCRKLAKRATSPLKRAAASDALALSILTATFSSRHVASRTMPNLPPPRLRPNVSSRRSISQSLCIDVERRKWRRANDEFLRARGAAASSLTSGSSSTSRTASPRCCCCSTRSSRSFVSEASCTVWSMTASADDILRQNPSVTPSRVAEQRRGKTSASESPSRCAPKSSAMGSSRSGGGALPRCFATGDESESSETLSRALSAVSAPGNVDHFSANSFSLSVASAASPGAESMASRARVSCGERGRSTACGKQCATAASGTAFFSWIACSPNAKSRTPIVPEPSRSSAWNTIATGMLLTVGSRLVAAAAGIGNVTFD